MTLTYDANLVMGKLQRAYEREVTKMKSLRDEQLELAKVRDLQVTVAYENFVKKCRRPTLEEYVGWLALYLVKDGCDVDVVHPIEFHQAPDYLLVNDEGVKITRLFHPDAKRIIIPKEYDIKLDSDIGDNVLYFMKDASVFNQTDVLPRVQSFLDVTGYIGAIAATAKMSVN